MIVLAGYTDDMSRFLRTNPGLASRFSVRIAFPSYQPDELVQIATIFAEQAGDLFAPDAIPVLTEILTQACDDGRIDELGNGRYARSLYERACASRDLRVAQLGELASAADLTTSPPPTSRRRTGASAADRSPAGADEADPAAGPQLRGQPEVSARDHRDDRIAARRWDDRPAARSAARRAGT